MISLELSFLLSFRFCLHLFGRLYAVQDFYGFVMDKNLKWDSALEKKIEKYFLVVLYYL